MLKSTVSSVLTRIVSRVFSLLFALTAAWTASAMASVAGTQAHQLPNAAGQTDRATVEPPTPTSMVTIKNVRLRSAPATEPAPSAILEFDILNQAGMTVTDLVFEVSIAQKPEPDHAPGPKHVVAGPFTIKGTIDLDAGYTIAYEVLLRNLSSDCSCAPEVHVVSVTWSPPRFGS